MNKRTKNEVDEWEVNQFHELANEARKSCWMNQTGCSLNEW